MTAGLLIIDMINELAFEGAEALVGKAETVADVVLKLRDEADRLRLPVIYVNDNYGQWHAEPSKIIAACSHDAAPGRGIVQRLMPRPDDYFVIKPRVSGFYATNLPILLPQLGVNRLVLVGVAADICVLFTAADAHMRDYDLWIPATPWPASATSTPAGRWTSCAAAWARRFGRPPSLACSSGCRRWPRPPEA